MISYYFSEKYGENQSKYLNSSSYQYSGTNTKIGMEVAELISVLLNTLHSTQYKYIVHNTKKHKNVPLWVLTNALSLGKISKMFGLCLASVQQKVCNEYPFVSISEMRNMLSVLTKFRNVCAHNERLYNYNTRDALPIMQLHRKMGLVSAKNNVCTKGTNDFFAVIIIFKTLLANEDFSAFFHQIYTLINEFSFKSNIVNRIVVLNKMGFPSNWQDIINYTNEPE